MTHPARFRRNPVIQLRSQRAEALKQTVDAQRKRAAMARIRNIAFVVVTILAVLAGWLYWRAEQQRQTADNLLFRVTKIIAKLQGQMDADTKHEVLAIFQMGAQFGNTTSVRSLGELYQNAQDYANALEWYKTAVETGARHR